ncbi:MAG TPA: phytoene desaturase family protein [Pseudonocardiaceae bacterium]
MRTVRGRTDEVVIVGAGLGGLSAALRLAAAGRQVTVLEREDQPGGRAGVLHDGGYSFDTGPTVLTMPDLIADALGCVGERLEDWLDLLPVDPVYRARYADGSTMDVHADEDAMADEVRRVCGPAEAAGYRRYVRFATRVYRYEMRDFIDRNLDSPWSVLTPNLARLAAIGGFRRLAPRIGRHLKDPRTRRILGFQSMYAGVSPYQALALYAVIGYMDCVAGVHFVRGGMHAVPRALAAAAEKHGVRLRYGTTVTRVELRGDRAVAVHTAGGERVPCDAVVLNPDLPVAQRELLGTPPRPATYSPSCFLLLAGGRPLPGAAPDALHTITFGRSWRGVFRELIDEHRLMSDPSFLVSTPTVLDPGLAPPGREIRSVLFPTPNLEAGIDWTTAGPRYLREVVDTLERRGYAGFGAATEVRHVTTPLDWQRRGMERGTPFAAAHTFRQSGPFRPANLWGQNVVFAGSGTHPGVGVPMVLVSGRLAAERITGPVTP